MTKRSLRSGRPPEAFHDAETINPESSYADASHLGGSDIRPIVLRESDPNQTRLAAASLDESHSFPTLGANGPLTIGDAFGARYRIISLLGLGGMGAVYKAWDAELGEIVALKVVRAEVMANPEAARMMERRFKQELLLARKVTHRNVVRIHDLGEENGIKYITMSFVEGEDLATLLTRDTKLPVARALKIARGIVAGLRAAHAAEVVHRDLKPANIVVTADTAMIMDFGVARSAGSSGGRAGAAGLPSLQGLAVGAQTVAGAIIGTVEYMAPEQAKAQAVDHRADIYAFGLIFYDMLVGRQRFAAAESAIAELTARMVAAPPSPRSIDPKIPEKLDALITKCLQPDPAARFQTTQDLLSALKALDDEGKPLPALRRLTGRVIAMLVVTVAVLVGGAFFTARWLTTPTKPHDPVSVVIADFQNKTTDPTVGRTLGQTVRRALEDASFISAYDRNRLQTLGMRPPERLDEVAGRELAVKQGLGVLVAGSIAPDGEGFGISVKAIQAVTGDTIANFTDVASSKGQVLETVTKLVARVRKALGDRTSTSAQLFAMRTLSASSLEVVSHYAAAVEAQSKGKYDDARKSYLRTIELDPKFGLGYQGLAAMSRNLGRTDEAEKYSKEALRFLDTLTERERFATRAYYYRTIGDNEQCAKEYGELLARYPADAVAHSQRAACLSKLRKLNDAVSEAAQAAQALPNHVGIRGNLALVYDLSGNFEAAERELLAIEEPNRPLIPLAYSYVGRGSLTQAAQTYEKMRRTGASGASSAISGLADLGIYQGRFTEAVRLLQDGAAADLSAQNKNKAAIKFTSAAYAELLHGQPGRAATAAELALASSPTMAVRFLAGRTLAEIGALEKARGVAATLTAEAPAEPKAHGKILEGLIALKSGNPSEAIRILSEANNTLDTWFGHFDLGRAYFEAGEFVQADSEFDVCLTRRGEALSLMDEGPTYGYFPIVYYFQGRVREALNTAGFADSYTEYLKIRGTSAEDPLVREVRKRANQ